MDFLNKVFSSFDKFGDRNAFCILGEYHTYGRLAKRVAALQQLLLQHPEYGNRVGILIQDTLDTYAGIIATLLLGKTYVPIHPAHPAERVLQVVEQADLKIVFSDLEEADYAGTKNVNTAQIADSDAALSLTEENLNDIYAYILFTSGSTGKPKGTPITYWNVASFTDAFFRLGYQLSEEDRFLQMFDLTFDLSVMSYLVPLCVGACVYPVPEKGMKFMNVYGLLEEHSISFALMVPSVLTFLRQYFDEIDLPAMRYSLFCGEALHKDVVLEWQKCIPNAIIDNVYGPTEATIFCLTYRIDVESGVAANNGIVCIGKPMHGMDAAIADDENKLLPTGEKGELCLSGNQLTPGYLDAEKTKLAFFEREGIRYYRTGDIALREADGNFTFCGRVDHQVKVQGFRIELSEIEHHARTTCSCSAVALVVANTKGLDQIEVVLETQQMDTEKVLEGLRQHLPAYMMPAAIHFVSPFPLNVNGKIDRRELQKLIQNSAI